MADQPDAQEVDQFIIYGAYGDLMHTFQVLEMAIWTLLSQRIKSKTTLDQTMNTERNWDDATLGGLVHQAKDLLPSNLVERFDAAVGERNYLAHHFLREYFIAEPSPDNRERALQYLAGVDNQLDELSSLLDAYMESQGFATPEALEPELRAQTDLLRPKDWPLER